jgi:hypothetical protein
MIVAGRLVQAEVWSAEVLAYRESFGFLDTDAIHSYLLVCSL